MGNRECHSCARSFYLGLSNNILYNSTQGCGQTAVLSDTLYSKSVLPIITVLRKETEQSGVRQSYSELWPSTPKAAHAHSGLQASLGLV